MRALAILANPWCFFSLLLLIVLLLIAAALVARSRARPRRRFDARHAAPTPRERTETAAPLEALQALNERLAELQRHAPDQSEDARWLESFRNDLRNVIDDVYWGLVRAEGAARVALLERLDREVARLDQLLLQRFSTSMNGSTDSAELHAQLERIRRSILSGEA